MFSFFFRGRGLRAKWSAGCVPFAFFSPRIAILTVFLRFGQKFHGTFFVVVTPWKLLFYQGCDE
jgi:hypothetical protein